VLTRWLKYLLTCAFVLLLSAAWSASAFAAVNAVTGGIGGINNGTLLGGDGTGTARITLNVTAPGIVKQARDLGGNVLPDNADVFSGQEIYFLLFVDNESPYAAVDLRIIDQLSEAEFTYIQGTLETAVVPSGSGDAAIWAGPWNALSDTLGAPDDSASFLDTGGQPGRDRLTIGSVPGQANLAVDIPGNSLVAIRFRARVN